MSDYISRAQAIEVIKRCKTAEQSQSGEVRNWTVDTCADAVKRLPPAQPERKTGRWIPCPQNASWLYVYKCSECGGYLQISDVDGKGYKANYCSYCGAKMEGGEVE